MKNKVVDGLYAAFDLGSVSIKSTIFEASEGKLRLASIEEEALKPLADFPGEDEYRVHQVESLKRLADRLPLGQCRSVSALFAHRELQVKIIDLPAQVMPDQVDKILNWEAKKLLSPNFRDELYSFSYRIIRENPYTVALCVVPQRILERFVELFDLAGVNLDGVYGEVFSAHSLYETLEHTGLPAVSIVNLGHQGTHLQIFSAGELRFYRFIPSGMGEMSSPPTTSELEMYSQKIRFSFDYFRAVSKLSQIDALYFMGGGPAQPEILPFKRSYFNPTRINIVDISSVVDITLVLSETTQDMQAEDKQRRLLPFIPAAGAVLASMAAEADHMNLARQLRDRKREERMRLLARKIPMIMAAVGFAVAAILIIFMRYSLSAKIVELNKNLDYVRMDIEAANTHIARLSAGKTTEATKLSSSAKKALEPMLKALMPVDNALFYVFRSAGEKLKIEEVLVRNELEAENINFEEEETAMTFGTQPGEDTAEKKDPYKTTLADQTFDTEQLRDGLGGRILIVKGLCDDNEILGAYVEELASRRVIKRVRSLATRSAGGKSQEFLLKGVMP